VPQTATAPILVLVGAMMMGESKKIDWSNMSEAVPAYFTTVMMPFSYRYACMYALGVMCDCTALSLCDDDDDDTWCHTISNAIAQIPLSPSSPPVPQNSITNGILFGIVMSLAFYCTTGDTVIARACALLGSSGSAPAAPGAAAGGKPGAEGGGPGPTPTSHPALRSPFLDSRLMER
jgi:hypothetical protein